MKSQTEQRPITKYAKIDTLTISRSRCDQIMSVEQQYVNAKHNCVKFVLLCAHRSRKANYTKLHSNGVTHLRQNTPPKTSISAAHAFRRHAPGHLGLKFGSSSILLACVIWQHCAIVPKQQWCFWCFYAKHNHPSSENIHNTHSAQCTWDCSLYAPVTCLRNRTKKTKATHPLTSNTLV